MWQRAKAVGNFWMNDPTLAAAGRAKARFGAVLATVGGVVALIERAWGVVVVCLVAAVLLVLIGRAAERDAEPKP